MIFIGFGLNSKAWMSDHMEQGKILAQGSHGELLKRCALYRRMWDQFRTTRLFRYSTGPALAASANTGVMQ